MIFIVIELLLNRIRIAEKDLVNLIVRKFDLVLKIPPSCQWLTVSRLNSVSGYLYILQAVLILLGTFLT